MQGLNAHAALYDALVKLEASDHELSAEERIMSASLRKDFEQGGIGLGTADRGTVVALNSRMHELGSQFTQNLQQNTLKEISFHPEALKPLPSVLIKSLKRSSSDPGKVIIPMLPSAVSTVMQWVSNPTVRRKIYEASVCHPNTEVLKQLLNVREELASALSFENYLSISLRDRASTESPMRFLESLAKEVEKKARQEVRILKSLKSEAEGAGSGVHIYPWDRSYYMAQAKAKLSEPLDGSSLCEYFSLSSCVEGMGMLVKSLFGIDLLECEASENELWHPDVKKMQMRHETEGVLGYIYLDLYPRAGKYNHAAQFTIRCGRDQGPGVDYQKPVVALVCNFTNASGSDPVLLSHGEAETLFHEFGHACHSLLSRTKFQHLSGTRGPVDFVEIPSHLFEHFIWDHRVLSKFARSVYTGRAISQNEIDRFQRDSSMFSGMDIQQQILLSAFDLELHTKPSSSNWTQVYSDLFKKFACITPATNVPWETTFGHVVGYGAGYYSYLYAKVIASEIWQALFQKDPTSRASGDRLRSDFLIYGGSRDPKELITSLVGQDMSVRSYLGDAGILDDGEQHAKENRERFKFLF
mmetsp:Transcript_7942/g.35263  ORF Transcript_7942/g.35263 Transcript_7942/m.35263 type:complete len:584 (-) Transcript_7942:101-1852(-)